MQLLSTEAAAEAVHAFINAFTLSMPTGKINTFANRTSPDALYVAIRKDQPLNLVGAFEHPVIAKDDGYINPSIKAFSKKANNATAWIEKPLASFAVNELLNGIDGVDVLPSLKELLNRLDKVIKGII
jgi:CRISPR system Cascade subunit CasC